MKKILIVYYSRTGTTEKIAKLIRQHLNCDTEELVDLKRREGILGNLSGGIDALLQRKTAIRPVSHDPSQYDLVIMGTPVWGGNMAPALRSYITANKDQLPQTAFFCTFGGKGALRTEAKFAELAGEVSARLAVKKNDTEAARLVDDFIGSLPQ